MTVITVIHPGLPPPPRNILITFDDGLADLYTIAYPYLKKHNIPFTAFIATDFLDKEGYITTEQLKTLASDELVTIGAHGVTHTPLPKLSKEGQEYELRTSKEILEKIIDNDVTIFAYPYGQKNKDTLKLISKIYKYAFDVCDFGVNIFMILLCKMMIPRYNIVDSNIETQMKKIDKILNIKR